MFSRYLSLTVLSLMFIGETPQVYAGDVVYSPPDVGAPSRRVGAGVRSGKDIGKATPFIGALIPKTTGLTLQAQPTLYWTSNLSVKRPLEIVLQHAKPTSTKERLPLLSLTLKTVDAGLHAIDLKAHNVRLKPDVLYQWSVTAIMSDMPSGDAFASGYILYQPMSAVLSKKLADTPPSEQANFYANNGIWYDAVSTLSQQIAQQPNNQALKQNRIKLMQQVVLPDEVIDMLK